MSNGRKTIYPQLFHTYALIAKAIIPLASFVAHIEQKKAKPVAEYLEGVNSSVRELAAAFNFVNQSRKDVVRSFVKEKKWLFQRENIKGWQQNVYKMLLSKCWINVNKQVFFFFHRNQITLRKTTVSQHVPERVVPKLMNFILFFRSMRIKHKYALSNIIAMDVSKLLYGLTWLGTQRQKKGPKRNLKGSKGSSSKTKAFKGLLRRLPLLPLTDHAQIS